MNGILFPLLAVFLGLFVFYTVYASHRYRANAIRDLANSVDMHYLGDALPKSMTLKGTPFHRISKAWNVIDGEPRGTRIMVFDCQVGGGKTSWRRTLIAVETDGNALGELPLSSDMTIDRSGRWQILYHQKAHFSLRTAGLIPVEELRENLTAVLAVSAKKSPKPGSRLQRTPLA
jgi:hypothetical protein